MSDPLPYNELFGAIEKHLSGSKGAQFAAAIFDTLGTAALAEDTPSPDDLATIEQVVLKRDLWNVSLKKLSPEKVLFAMACKTPKVGPTITMETAQAIINLIKGWRAKLSESKVNEVFWAAMAESRDQGRTTRVQVDVEVEREDDFGEKTSDLQPAFVESLYEDRMMAWTKTMLPVSCLSMSS